MDVLRLLAAVCAGAAANQAPNTICGTQPAVCNGTFAGRALDLSVSGLTGTLPPELGSLKLGSLILASNNISGTLPPELAKLTQLQQFNLSFNNLLSGTVPPGLAKMSQLQRLDLAHTSLSGSIPGNMGQLSQLQRLDMAVTAISGTLPPTLGDLSQLKELTITENGLSGTLPPTFRKLSHLEFLSVARGSLSGTLPPFSAQLEYLAVSHNRFSGTLPRLEISQTLALRNNSFAYTKTSARVCVHNNIECVGVPPLGCSAFANEWRESISNANECVRCDVSAPALAFIGVGFVLVVVVRLALRHPSSLKRWVSTATILINHGQTASTIASLRLEWPQALIDLASALRLELPRTPAASLAKTWSWDPCRALKAMRFSRQQWRWFRSLRRSSPKPSPSFAGTSQQPTPPNSRRASHTPCSSRLAGASISRTWCTLRTLLPPQLPCKDSLRQDGSAGTAGMNYIETATLP